MQCTALSPPPPVKNTPECRVCEEKEHVQVLLLSPHSLLIYFLSKTDYSPLFSEEKKTKCGSNLSLRLSTRNIVVLRIT